MRTVGRLRIKTLSRVHDIVIVALAVIAGAMLAVVSVFIIYDVMLRNMLISPPAWIVPTAEYGLLYVTMLAAPWLARTRGHVMIQVLHQHLPARLQRHLERAVYVICITICWVLSGFLIDLLIAAYQSGEADVRAITVPHTYLYWPMLIGFFLLGCEFLRYLLGKESIYTGATSHRERIE